jgi:hypothetical protein
MSGDDIGALESCGEKSMVSEEIDFSGQTAGGLEESLLSRGLEENRLGTGESEAVLKVGGQLIASQRGEMETDDDALGESFVNGHRESSSKLGLSEQEQAEAVLGIHVVVGEKAKVLENVGAEVMGLIDDEDRPAACLGDEPCDLGADLSKQGGAGTFDGQSHFPGDGLVEVHDVAGGKTNVEHPEERRVQSMKHLSTAASFSAAAVAGDEADTSELDEVSESDLELFGGGGGEELVGFDLVAEGMVGQAEVLAVHLRAPRSV